MSMVWEYVSGAGMYGGKASIAKGGYGTLLIEVKIGNSLMIGGDLGIVTSQIKELEPQEDGSTLVKTQNSVYRIKKW
jgi:hypothetical protein